MTPNFIHLWKKAIPDEVCDQVIEIFEDVVQKNPQAAMYGRTESMMANIHRNDVSFSLDDSPLITDDLYPNKKSICEVIDDRMHKCYKEYTKEYGQLDKSHRRSDLKIQKTMPYGGYHTWHYEQAGPDNTKRELVWMIYLNTMPPHEAETEFLYQAVKIQPVKGSVCIFPAAMTHVHRGLTVYTQPKYIITGWFLKNH
jgi:hypothetical protein